MGGDDSQTAPREFLATLASVGTAGCLGRLESHSDETSGPSEASEESQSRTVTGSSTGHIATRCPTRRTLLKTTGVGLAVATGTAGCSSLSGQSDDPEETDEVIDQLTSTPQPSQTAEGVPTGTDSPTDSPTGSPTDSPTGSPTDSPTDSPTNSPTPTETFGLPEELNDMSNFHDEHEEEYDRLVARDSSWQEFHNTLPNDDENVEIKSDNWALYPELTGDDGRVYWGPYDRFLFDDEHFSYTESDSVGDAMSWAFPVAWNWQWNKNGLGHPDDIWKIAAATEDIINSFTDASAHVWPLEFFESIEGGYYDSVVEDLERDDDNRMRKMMAYDENNDEIFMVNVPQSDTEDEQGDYFDEEFRVNGKRFYEFVQNYIPRLENSVFVKEGLYSDEVVDEQGTPTPTVTANGPTPLHKRAGDDTFGAGNEGEHDAIDNFHAPFDYHAEDPYREIPHRESTVLNDKMFRNMVRSPATVPPEDEQEDSEYEWDDLSEFGEDAHTTMTPHYREALTAGFIRPEFRQETDAVGFEQFFRHGAYLHALAEDENAWSLYLNEDNTTRLAEFEDETKVDDIRTDTDDYDMEERYDPVNTYDVPDLEMPWFDNINSGSEDSDEQAGLVTAIGLGLVGAVAGSVANRLGYSSHDGVVDAETERVNLAEGVWTQKRERGDQTNRCE